MSQFVKGQAKPDGSGRKKGTPNRVTNQLRETILEAFEEVGGADWLKELAASDPKAFATLLGKLVPRESQVSGDDVPLLILRDYTGRSAERGA